MNCPNCRRKMEADFILAFVKGFIGRTPSNWMWRCECGTWINTEDVRRAMEEKAAAVEKQTP